MADGGVPGWLLDARRKYLKREGVKVVSFRSRLAEALALHALKVRAKEVERTSAWAAWFARQRGFWKDQGYDERTINQMAKESLTRQMGMTARRAATALEYQRQQQDGGFF